MQTALLVIEIIIALMFLAAFPVLNAGNLSVLLLCGVAVFFTADCFGSRKLLAAVWENALGKAAIAIVCLLFAAGLVTAGVISAKMAGQIANEPESPPEVIVVLGCQVRGERPSKMLMRRITTAYDALVKYPDAVCVVSGGQGSDEAISEAECMYRTLTEMGIDPSRLIKEDTSTTTSENIRNTFKLTDPLGYSRDITIVTDGFHQYRASLIAKKAGADDVKALSAHTELRFIPTYWVREWLGILYFHVTGK